jgi:hypothetical protein
MTKYRVGDCIVQWCFGSPEAARTVIVDGRSANIKNGRSGFSGHTPQGLSVWGYDDEVQAVMPTLPNENDGLTLMFPEDY